MPETYKNITNIILRELNEVLLTDANYASATNIQAHVKDTVNRAYRDIIYTEEAWPFMATGAPSNDFDGNTSFETVAGTRFYLINPSATTIDDDYASVDLENVTITKYGVAGETAPYYTRNLRYMAIEDWKQEFQESEDSDRTSDTPTYGEPKRIFLSADRRRFGISPIPDGVYKLYFTAYDQLTALSAATDEIRIPSQYLPVLMARIRYYVYQFKGRSNEAQFALAEYKKSLRSMREALHPFPPYVKAV
ncbi:hypothetical protein N9937_01975 [bacterium]|nr:hypothetical protein [bacterium]